MYDKLSTLFCYNEESVPPRRRLTRGIPRPSLPPQIYQSMNHFKYEPLDLDFKNQSIRLIRVHPANRSRDEYIHCTMEHSTTSASYACFSYMWDPETPWTWIVMNGKYLSVRKNLYKFLRIANSMYDTTEFWIGALCINQYDSSEKNHQVQQVGLIYSLAREVVIWLGKNDEVEEGFQIERCDSKLRFKLFNDPYWSRAWVTQEILLAQHKTVLVDKSKLPWRIFTSVSQRSSDYSSFHGFGEYASSLRSQSLLRLLHHFDSRESTIPRDRIFSLLSKCGAGNELQVDYNLPDGDLMFQVLELCKEDLCLCSAVILAHNLGLAKCLPKKKSQQYYLEIDVEMQRKGLGAERYLTGSVAQNSRGIVHNRNRACNAVMGEIHWRYGVGVMEGPDYHQPLTSDWSGPKAVYAVGSPDSCAMRIAFGVLAKAFAPPRLCRNSRRRQEDKDGRSSSPSKWLDSPRAPVRMVVK